MAEAVPQRDDLAHEVSLLYQLLLPNIAVPTVLARLDVAPDRPLRLKAAAEAAAEANLARIGGGSSAYGEDGGED